MRIYQFSSDYDPPLKCERCDLIDGCVKPRDSRTMYVWDSKTEDDPNADWELCDDCADEYEAYWDEMWAEYNNSRL